MRKFATSFCSAALAVSVRCLMEKTMPSTGCIDANDAFPKEERQRAHVYSNSQSRIPADEWDAVVEISRQHPVIQFPSESLLRRQRAVDIKETSSDGFQAMIARLRFTREHYQYPALSAPQIGWNARVFTLFDGSVWVNPEIFLIRRRGVVEEGWTWEPCPSCHGLVHYIKRPTIVLLSGCNEFGEEISKKRLTGMAARMAQHEVDHLNGELFSKKVPDVNHIVPLEGFAYMSEWPDDFPSLEARSTFMYSLLVPPYKITSEGLPASAAFLTRTFEDLVFPGHDLECQLQNSYKEQKEETKQAWRQLLLEQQKQEEGKFTQMRFEGEETDPDANSPSRLRNAKDVDQTEAVVDAERVEDFVGDTLDFEVDSSCFSTPS